MKEFTFRLKREKLRTITWIAETPDAALEELKKLNDYCKLENIWAESEDTDSFELVGERELKEQEYEVTVKRMIFKKFRFKTTCEEEAGKLGLEAAHRTRNGLFEESQWDTVVDARVVQKEE